MSSDSSSFPGSNLGSSFSSNVGWYLRLCLLRPLLLVKPLPKKSHDGSAQRSGLLCSFSCSSRSVELLKPSE
jgi:hypothetical protein